jgi:hypothetical protein
VSLLSLDRLWSDGHFDEPLLWRLGFREFGTSIGLQVSRYSGRHAVFCCACYATVCLCLISVTD